MAYTLGEAARTTGKGKTTILKAIKSGRISANKNSNDEWQIEPSELHRVYPVVPANSSPEPIRETASELIELRVKVEVLNEQVGNLKDEREDLRRRLDQSEDERRKTQSQLTAFLTDQRTLERSKGFWRWLIGKNI